MQPVGPEEPQTYWARRAAVLVVLLVLIGLVTWLVVGSRGGSQAAGPPESPAPQTSAPTSTGPSSSSSASSPSSSSPSPTSTADPSASTDTKDKKDSDKKSDKKDSDKKDAEKKDSEKKDSEKKDADKKDAEKKDSGSTACDPESIRATLTGPTSAKAKSKQTYELSLINGSDETCVLPLDAKHFELKIYSGTDRIWSSVDCSKALPETEKKLKPEQAHEWKMTWNGSRSAAKCTVDDGAIRAGTYVATAQFKGAKPVQHVFTIKD